MFRKPFCVYMYLGTIEFDSFDCGWLSGKELAQMIALATLAQNRVLCDVTGGLLTGCLRKGHCKLWAGVHYGTVGHCKCPNSSH